MRALRLRTLAWIMFALILLSVSGAGLYGWFRILPKVRQLNSATSSLQRLYGRLAEDERSLTTAYTAATRVVVTGDAAAAARLRASLADRDRLVGDLPLADVPRGVRESIARAEDLARIRSPRRQSVEEKRRTHTQLVDSALRDLRR